MLFLTQMQRAQLWTMEKTWSLWFHLLKMKNWANNATVDFISRVKRSPVSSNNFKLSKQYHKKLVPEISYDFKISQLVQSTKDSKNRKVSGKAIFYIFNSGNEI